MAAPEIAIGVAGLIATLLAAFGGTWFAFRLQNLRAKREQLQNETSHGNLALFTLGRQLNELAIVRDQTIEPHRNDTARMINLRPIEVGDFSELKIGVEDTSFLLRTDSRQMLMEIYIAQRQFERVTQALSRRHYLHVMMAQPMLEQAGFKNQSTSTKEDVLRALGYRLFSELEEVTEEVIGLIDRTIEAHADLAKRLRESLCEIFPKSKFIKMEMRKKAAPGESKAGQAST